MWKFGRVEEISKLNKTCTWNSYATRAYDIYFIYTATLLHQYKLGKNTHQILFLISKRDITNHSDNLKTNTLVVVDEQKRKF